MADEIFPHYLLSFENEGHTAVILMGVFES